MNQYTIPNLVKAIDVLRLISIHAQGLNAATIEQHVGIPRTTTYRILQTLLEVQVISKQGNLYFPGPSLVEIGLNTLNSLEIRTLAAPFLKDLTQKTGYTSHLAVPSDRQSMIIEVCDSPHPVRVASRTGTRVDMYCSATGKVFLSYLHADSLDQQLRGQALTARTPKTLIDRPSLQAMTQQVVQQGYAVDDCEFHQDIRCLAAPVFSVNQQVVAALGVTAPTTHFTETQIESISHLVMIAAQQLSNRLGAPSK